MTSALPLAGRRLLVTGGGSGIGRAVVDAYVAAGGQVTVLERSTERASQLRDDQPRVAVLVGDANDPGALEEAVQTAAPDGALDHLTCCVGMFDHYASICDLDASALTVLASQIWQVNVGSVLLAVNRARAALTTAHGSVTVTVSESAYRTDSGGGVLYSSSKWALRGVVAHLARDLAPHIRVNGVAPGGTSGTHFGDRAGPDRTAPPGAAAARGERIRRANLLHVLPAPVDHAGAYLYLADPVASRVVTGMIIRTDGGLG